MRDKTIVNLFALAGLSATAPALAALEPSDVLLFSKGPVTLRPQLSVSEVYNDNIFYRSDNKVDDFITVISPGLNIQLGTQDYNFINASLFYDRVIHALETDQSANQYRFALDSRFQRGKFTIAGRDQIEFLSSVLGGGISLSGVRVDRTTYFDEYRLTIDLSEKTAVYIEGTHNTTDFQDDIPLYDSNTLMGTLGFQYKAFERLWFFGEGYYGQTALDPNAGRPKTAHSTFMGGFAGARGFFTEKLSGSVKAGYETREFAGDSESVSLPVVEMSATQRFTENTSLSIAYSRRQRVSLQYAQSEFTANYIGLNLRQIIGNTGRLRLDVKGGYGFNNYEPSLAYSEPSDPLTPRERNDDVITAGAELSYDFKIWLRGTLGYNYERLRSDLSFIEDYDVNRVTLGLSVGY
jgi:hypothetical protein